MVEEKAGRTTNKQNNVINPPVSIYSLGKHLNDGITPPPTSRHPETVSRDL